MPLYDYDCLACGRRIEVVHGVHAPGPTHCPNCGSGPLKKAIAAPAVHFKGSGWAKKERRATVAPGTARSAGDSATSEGEASGGATAESRTANGPGSEPANVIDRPDKPVKTGAGTAATRTD